MGLTVKNVILALLLSMIFTPELSYSQNQECFITAPLSPDRVYAKRFPSVAVEADHILATKSWDNLENARVSDEAYLSIDLERYDRSHVVRFSGFDFNVPDLATIDGLRIAFEGRVIGEGAVSQMQVQFYNNGPIGNNVSDIPSLLGTEWINDSLSYDRWWKYGNTDDKWGKEWTSAEVNSADFGFALQIENQTDEFVQALLDQVAIFVYYTPPHNLCAHECIVFSTPPIDGVTNYNWEFPSNFEQIVSPVNQEILNLNVLDNVEGAYQVCVTPEGHTKCCMDFVIMDCSLASVGNRVWKDSNSNGVQDDGEVGIPGVRVQLFNESGYFLEDTFTDNNGNYLFDDLYSGNYRIKTGAPTDDCEVSISSEGDENTDSDYDFAYGFMNSGFFYLAPGENRDDIDFGWSFKHGAIAGCVFRDRNGDSLIADEPGIEGITVNLHQCDGTLVTSTTTNADGRYTFEELMVGQYYVSTSENPGFIAAVGGDSGFIDGSYNSNCVDVMPATETEIKLGFIPLGRIGDYIFYDEDENGIHESGDWPIVSLQVFLYNVLNEEIASTVTSADGLYLFDNLPAGEYYVVANYPSSAYLPTDTNPNDDPAMDSNGMDIGNMQVSSGIVNLFDGATDLTIDFGFVKRTATINGTYFRDGEGDGLLTGNVGIPGATVSFYNCNGALIATRTTDVNGAFSFTGFVGQEYHIVFSPVGGMQTSAIGESQIDNVIAEGATACFTIPDETTITMNGAAIPFSRVGNMVWNDENRNGLFDNAETGIENVEVTLFDSNNNMVGTTLTNSEGVYIFENLLPDLCYIELKPIDDFEITESNVGSDETLDSDADMVNGIISSESFNLVDGYENMDMDFGFRVSGGSVSGRLWNDGDGDAIYGNENGIDNQVVRLMSCDGSLINSMETNSEGIFIFTPVPAGDYYVAVGEINNFTLATTGDSQINNIIEVGATDCFTVVNAQTVDVLLGAIPLSGIGNYIWLDLNQDGIQDDSETGIANVGITLFDQNGTNIESTQTDAEGMYTFSNIPAGNYTIEVDIPAGHSLTLSNVGDFNFDSEGTVNGNVVESAMLALRDGINQNDHDFGFYLSSGNLSGIVWRDSNGNELNDGEQGMEGIGVSLYSCAIVLLDATMTDENGAFSFDNLSGGQYFVVANGVSGYQLATAGDSQITNVIMQGATNCFDVGGNVTTSVVMGFIPLSEIGDYVWDDTNRNGLQDDMESGIDDVEVGLFDEEGALLEIIETDEEGFYQFTNVRPGSYNISVALPDEEYINTISEAGDSTLDSEGTLIGNMLTSETIVIFDGMDQNDHDFGFYENTGSFSGTVWRDSNGDALNENEEGMEGIGVSLYSCAMVLIDATMTDANGAYSFDNITSGSYFVVANAVQGFELATGGDSQITNIIMSGATDCIDVATGASNISLGFIPLASLGDYIWFDEDKDGLQGATESGLDDVEVELLDGNGTLLESTITDENGFYEFINLRPGSYSIAVALPGDEFTNTISQAGDSTLDSEGTLINNNLTSGQIVLFDGMDQNDHDFGFIEKEENPTVGDVTGSYIRDSNGDGILDSDAGIEGETIILKTCDGALVSMVTTDENGNFSFPNITAGDYYLVFPTAVGFTNVDFGESQIDNALEDGATPCFTVLADLGASVIGATIPLNSIGDYVWDDSNKDGIQDMDEIGIAGIQITLYDDNDVFVLEAVSDTAGYYQFKNVLPGNYYTSVNVGTYKVSPSEATTDDELDSNLNLINGVAVSNPIVLFDGVSINSIDFGLYKETNGGSDENLVSGFVYEDLNGNGMFDLGETRINDVSISLVLAGVVLDNATSFASAQGDGFYEFSGFPNGDYTIIFDLESTSTATDIYQGTNTNLDSDILMDDTEFTTESLTFTDGTVIQGVNAGYYYPVSVGDYVWFDFNGDGIQDDDEPGANDYVIRLYDGSGEQVLMTTSKVNPLTDENGFYLFNNLKPGDYYVGLNISFGTSVTIENAGTDENIDSDVDNSNGAGTTPIFSLISGEQKSNIDIGLNSTPGSIGNLLWLDNNGNGIQDAGELGLNDVEVNLYDENMNFSKSTVTADDDEGEPGFYIFENVPIGNYYVVFELEEPYLATAAFRGGNSSMDSDVTNLIEEGSSNIFSIGSGVYSDDIDCGVYKPATVGNYIWNDNDKDGTQEFGEFGAKDVEVAIFRMDEGEVGRVTTNNNGMYMFDNLRPGAHFIIVDKPDDYQFTQQDAGNDDTIDSDVDMTGTTEVFYVDQEDLITTYDAGLVPARATIGGRTWDDDGNGLQDFIEESIVGVTVHLLDENQDLIETTQTNVQGRYAFTNLSTADHYIQFEAPAGYTFTDQDQSFNDNEDSDADDNGLTDVIAVTSTTSLLTVDAGFILGGLAVESLENIKLSGYHQNGNSHLSWIDENFESGRDYAILRSTDGINFEMISKKQCLNSYELRYLENTSLLVENNYYYKVEKYVGAVVKAESNIWKDNQKEMFHVDTYPNPASEYVMVQFDHIEESDVSIMIMDMFGNKLTTKTFKDVGLGNVDLQVSLDNLPSGNYILMVDMGMKLQSQFISILK